MAAAEELPQAETRRAPKTRRFTLIWIVVAAVFVIAAAMVVFTQSASKGPASSVPKVSSTITGEKDLTTTHNYANQVRAEDQTLRQAAERHGDSFIPAPVQASGALDQTTSNSRMNLGLGGYLPTPKKPPEQSIPSSHPVRAGGFGNAYGGGGPGGQRQTRQQKVDALSASITAEFNHIAGLSVLPAAQTTIIQHDKDQGGLRQTGAVGAGAYMPPPATSLSAADAKSPVTPGQVLYAVETITLNSDTPGPANATIVGGKLDGAKLLGGFARHDDQLVVKFTNLVTEDGVVYPINAYAVDPDTSGTAVRSAVNHHYFSRWAGLIAATFLAGFGQAIANSGQTTTITPGGSVITSNADTSLNQQLWQAAGKVGQVAGSQLQQGFNRPPTVWLGAGTDIGILIVGVGR